VKACSSTSRHSQIRLRVFRPYLTKLADVVLGIVAILLLLLILRQANDYSDHIVIQTPNGVEFAVSSENASVLITCWPVVVQREVVQYAATDTEIEPVWWFEFGYENAGKVWQYHLYLPIWLLLLLLLVPRLILLSRRIRLTQKCAVL